VNTSPTLRSGSTTIVWEGARRLVWRRLNATNWVPTGLWPNAEQAAELADDIGNGGRLLIVLDPVPDTVEVLAEELLQAPPAVQRLAGDYSPASRPGPGEPGYRPSTLAERLAVLPDPVELAIPLLEWAPKPIRERGLQFRAESTALLDRYPAALLPRLLVEQPADAASPVRFVAPLPPSSVSSVLSGTQLAVLASHLYDTRPFGRTNRAPRAQPQEGALTA
jgi:hypothetical protein